MRQRRDDQAIFHGHAIVKGIGLKEIFVGHGGTSQGADKRVANGELKIL